MCRQAQPPQFLVVSAVHDADGVVDATRHDQARSPSALQRHFCFFSFRFCFAFAFAFAFVFVFVFVFCFYFCFCFVSFVLFLFMEFL